MNKNLRMDEGNRSDGVIGPRRNGGRKRQPEPDGRVWEAVVPNPKLKLMDQVREVMRLRQSIWNRCA